MKKPKPEPSNLFILIALLLLGIGKYTLSNIEPVRQPLKPSINDSVLYLQSKLSSSITTEVYVLGSITSPTIRELAFCESGLNPNAYNKEDPNGGSHGILQFSRDTFREFCVEKYGLRDDLYDPLIQIECATKMISQGYEQRWSCWDIIHR